MAERHHQITASGGRVAGISVDSPGQNEAMAAKLQLPFPLLSDPGGEQAIRPYGVWHEGNPYGRPAVVIVAPGARVTFREVGEDFADRLDEDEIIAALARLGLPPVTQDPPVPGQPAPGPGRSTSHGCRPTCAAGGSRCRRSPAGYPRPGRKPKP